MRMAPRSPTTNVHTTSGEASRPVVDPASALSTSRAATGAKGRVTADHRSCLANHDERSLMRSLPASVTPGGQDRVSNFMSESNGQKVRISIGQRVDMIAESLFLRYRYPMENRLLHRFGERSECGCETLWRRRLRLCWRHAAQTDSSKWGSD